MLSDRSRKLLQLGRIPLASACSSSFFDGGSRSPASALPPPSGASAGERSGAGRVHSSTRSARVPHWATYMFLSASTSLKNAGCSPVQRSAISAGSAVARSRLSESSKPKHPPPRIPPRPAPGAGRFRTEAQAAVSGSGWGDSPAESHSARLGDRPAAAAWTEVYALARHIFGSPPARPRRGACGAADNNPPQAARPVASADSRDSTVRERVASRNALPALPVVLGGRLGAPGTHFV